MKCFYCDISNDNRLEYACEYLKNKGFSRTDSFEKSNFVLLGVNPKDFTKYTSKPTFAGNVCANNVFDYTKNEAFAHQNAFLTAEGAISLAIENSNNTLINSKILIIGFGRIAKALCHLLKPFSNSIIVCARNETAREKAKLYGNNTICFEELKDKNDYDFVFNTVPHPVLNKYELLSLKDDAIIIDLASFPGGVDMHFAKSLNKNVFVARGLPAKYSPKSAGEVVAKTVISMIESGDINI